jgi:C4-type Zn-finger protein
MLDELLEPRCFGADDRLTCPKCRSALRLKNRSPDASYGHRYERQTFRCAACDFHIERSVDADGELPELVRYRVAELQQHLGCDTEVLATRATEARSARLEIPPKGVADDDERQTDGH